MKAISILLVSLCFVTVSCKKSKVLPKGLAGEEVNMVYTYVAASDSPYSLNQEELFKFKSTGKLKIGNQATMDPCVQDTYGQLVWEDDNYVYKLSFKPNTDEINEVNVFKQNSSGTTSSSDFLGQFEPK
ncbi:MAG TPA: hypothetical protein PLI97_00185 [Fluviicola sp.]|nr:hypothetical protein [Fluviicola sp.]